MAENHRGVVQKTTAWKKVGLIGENQEVETDFSGLSGKALEWCWSSFLKIYPLALEISSRHSNR